MYIYVIIKSVAVIIIKKKKKKGLYLLIVWTPSLREREREKKNTSRFNSRGVKKKEFKSKRKKLN